MRSTCVLLSDDEFEFLTAACSVLNSVRTEGRVLVGSLGNDETTGKKIAEIHFSDLQNLFALGVFTGRYIQINIMTK